MLSETEAMQKDILALALAGDGVWTLYVRERLIKKHDLKAGALSAKVKGFVNAAAQCKMLYAVKDTLTEAERDIVRRARNAHTSSRAKNATLDEYKKATALEALLGYLYLTGQKARLDEILQLCYGEV
ncbi:MAG: Mini-ribonuclease 3 [Firmicutes bacterium]|nr:Mini-ribonuclease 3 [Bacillota bacterium]